MYNNEPRFGIPLKPQTSSRVGPTTYILCTRKEQLENEVPFLSSGKKNPTFFYTPACNTFYGLTDNKKIPGGIWNKTPRFQLNVDCSPGPADYDIEATPPGPCGTGKLYMCKVPLSMGVVPSIPTTLNENGYSIDKDGNPIPNPPTDYDTTLGPAFYNAVPKSSYTYGGCKWSARKSKRSFFDQTNNPGPADYNVQMPKCNRETENDNYREMARLFNFVPRFLEAQEQKCLTENLPGPGYYNIEGKNDCPTCPSINPRPFISGTERFKVDKNQGPEPGDYNMKSPTTQFISKAGIPFSVNAPRFVRKTIQVNPGPADYDINEKMYKKSNRCTLFAPPFSSTAERNISGAKRDADSTPAPIDYAVDLTNRCKISVSSVFKSRVPRFKKLCTTPIIYNTRDTFNKLVKRQEYNAYEIPFGTKDRKRGLFYDLNTGDPDPARYDVHFDGTSGRCKGFVIPVSERFPELGGCRPEPATYNVPSTSVYRANFTHNIKLKESVLGTRIRKHPYETYGKWIERLRKQKKLKWFHNEGRGYRHCPV